MTTLFLSYARSDDEPFVERLYHALQARGFEVWWDRVCMPSRLLTFHQEIREAVATRERLVLVVGPRAVASDYVRQEWLFALQEDKVVTPILRLGEFLLVPDELKLFHHEDFRDDARFDFHLDNLARQLSEPPPRLGKLIAVPSLPGHYLERADRMNALRDALRADLDRPVVIGGAVARVGVHGMGGIGKSMLAAGLARDRKVREAFPDGIVWVGFGSLPDVPALQRRVHRDLGGDGAFDTEHQGKVRLKELLADKAVLLILDDVWRRPDVDWFDVLGPRCRALVTTRDTGLLTSLGGTHHMVELLTDREAQSVLALAAGVPRDGLPSEAARIIAECGRLPLALALVGGMIRRGLGWSSVLEQLQQARIDRIGDRHATEPHHQSIWQAIHVSVEFLSAEARQRFLELALFPQGEPACEADIGTLWAYTGGLDDWTTRELLVTLEEQSLLQSVPHSAGSGGPSGRRISLHDLVYDYARRAIPDIAALHGQLGNHCSNWMQMQGFGRDYAFRFGSRHLIEAKDFAGVIALVRGQFLEAKAASHGDFEALTDAGQMANALAGAGAEHWDDLVRCAFQYCTLAERVRGAPEALETLARSGEVGRVVQALDTERDPFRRGALTLAAGTLLRETGLSAKGSELCELGAEQVRSKLREWSAFNPPTHSYETGAVVQALLAAGDNRKTKKSAPVSQPAENPDIDSNNLSPREWVPWFFGALTYITSRRFSEFWVGGWMGWTFILVGLVIGFSGSWRGGGEVPNAVWGGGNPWVTGLGIAACTCPMGVLFLVLLGGDRLVRRNRTSIRRAMEELLAGCLRQQGRKRRTVLLRALRWDHLLTDLMPVGLKMERPWTSLLSRLTVQELHPDLEPRPAAVWLIGAAGLEDATCDALLVKLRLMPVRWLEVVYREIALRRFAWRNNHAVLRLALGIARLLDDPVRLLDLLKWMDVQAPFTGWEPHRGGRPEVVLQEVAPSFLARAVLAGARRRMVGGFEVLVLSLPNLRSVIKEMLECLRTPLSRWELLCFLGLLIPPAIGCLALLPLLLLFSIIIAGSCALAPLLVRLHDPHHLRECLRVTEDSQVRYGLLEHLEGRACWYLSPVQTRTVLSTVLAQSIIRNDRVDLNGFQAGVIRRSLAMLANRVYLSQASQILLHVMANRRLLDVAAGLRRILTKSAPGAQPADPATDREQIRRTLPVASAWHNFGLVMGLSLPLLLLSLVWLEGLSHSILASGSLYFTVLSWLSGGLCLALLQNLPYSKDATRDSVSLVAGHVCLLLLAFPASTFAFPFLISGLAWLASDPEAVSGVTFAEFSRQYLGHVGATILWLVVVWPLLIANLLVPALIARWRGAGLLYPSPAQLRLRRIGCVVLAVVVSFLLALFTSWLL